MKLTFLALAAALAAVCACLAIVCWRKCAEALIEVRGIALSLRGMRSKVEAHDGELEAVTDALRTLRGKFYAERRKLQTPSDASGEQSLPASPASSKDALRRKLGLVPGRPAPHQE